METSIKQHVLQPFSLISTRKLFAKLPLSPPPYLLWLREWPISILLSCLCSRLSSPSHSLSPLCFSVYRENKGGADNEHLRTDTSHTISDTASLIFPPPQTQHIFPRLKGSWQVILLMVSLGWQLGKKSSKLRQLRAREIASLQTKQWHKIVPQVSLTNYIQLHFHTI